MFDNFESVDLAARALKTVPVILHGHADTIVSLNLSRNPMLEIPLDFIQACTILRVLRLQNMAMKKVPQSVRHCKTLHRLDLSSNRIVNLDDAGLDHIPGLKCLKLQNNGMEQLPWYFPKLRALRELNISNNKFEEFPAVLSDMEELIDLDISFNSISVFPPHMTHLPSLERLIIVGNQIKSFPGDCSGLESLRTLDCRRNIITDLSPLFQLPKIEKLLADNNSVLTLELKLLPSSARYACTGLT